MTTLPDSQDLPCAQGYHEPEVTQRLEATEDSASAKEEPLLPGDEFLLTAVHRIGEAAMCFRCGMSCEKDAINKFKFKAVCKGCHSVYIMLVRNMAWPPADFSSLPEEQQKNFWASCKEAGKENGRFSYSNVRALLIKRCTNRLVHSHEAEEWTEGKPLEAWKLLGYDIAIIEKNARKVLNPTCGVLYEVPIHRTSRKCILEEVEERITSAEQQVKQKRSSVCADEDQLLASDAESVNAEEKPCKKPKKEKPGKMTDADRLAAKEAAAEARKAKAAMLKHNKEQQAIATRVIAILAKPVDEVKKAFQTLAKVADHFPPALKTEVEDLHKEILDMNSQASSIVKSSGQAAAKGTELDEFKWTVKVVMARASERKKVCKQFNVLMRALKL